MAAGERKRAVGRVEAKEGKAHTDHWQDALDDALAKAAQDLGPGTYDVEIQWRAQLDVSNPGRILGFEVVLERTTT
jgi:hypothetical protein